MAKLETLAAEQTVFEPPEAVKARAALQDYEAAHRYSTEHNEAFWAEAARELVWTKPWTRFVSSTASIIGGFWAARRTSP